MAEIEAGKETEDGTGVEQAKETSGEGGTGNLTLEVDKMEGDAAKKLADVMGMKV